jgi:hypothetical protein
MTLHMQACHWQPANGLLAHPDAAERDLTPTMRWRIDERTGRPVMRWVLSEKRSSVSPARAVNLATRSR